MQPFTIDQGRRYRGHPDLRRALTCQGKIRQYRVWSFKFLPVLRMTVRLRVRTASSPHVPSKTNSVRYGLRHGRIFGILTGLRSCHLNHKGHVLPRTQSTPWQALVYDQAEPSPPFIRTRCDCRPSGFTLTTTAHVDGCSWCAKFLYERAAADVIISVPDPPGQPYSALARCQLATVLKPYPG